MNIIIGSYLRADLLDIIWTGDDAIHIGVAKSFRENGSFEIPFTRGLKSFSVDSLITTYPTIESPQITKGPIHYILLGSFFKLMETNIEDSYLHASIFSNILTSIFLIIFFFWVRTKFSRRIAFFSSIIILLLPLFIYTSARVYLYPTLLIFSFAALFFLGKKKKHYLIFGILTGLAHLTHPFGIFLGISYVIFLLLCKEFKGSLITFLAWQTVLFPWFLRNYYLFQDIGRGLYIPFSEKFSGILSFLPTSEQVISVPPRIPETVFSEGVLLLNPFEIFLERFYQTFANFNMDYFIIFLLAFSGLAFFALPKLRKNLKYVLLGLCGLIVSYLAISGIQNVYLQIFSFFVLPVIFILILKKIKGSLFENHIPRHYKFIIFYSFITLTITYFWTLIAPFPHSLAGMFQISIILLIPLSIFGLDKLIKYSTSLQKIRYQKLIPIIMTLIILPLLLYHVEGIMIINEFLPEKLGTETGEIKTINNFVRKNILNTAKVASNQQYITNLRTDLKAVIIPVDIDEIEKMDRFIDHYGVSYLIFYDTNQFGDSKEPYHFFTNSLSPSYRLDEFYSIGNSHILKVEKQTAEHLKEKISEYLTLGKYSQALEGYNAIVVFYDREIDQLKKSGQLDKANTVQLSLESFTKERDDFVFTLADSNTKIIQKLVESNQYFEAMKVFDETIDFFEIYTKPEIIDQEKKAKIQQLIEEFKIGQHISLMAWDELLRKEVPILLDLKDDEEAIEFYKSLRDYYQKKYKTFEKSGNFNDAKKIKNSLVEYVGYNARLFMDHEMLHDAERAYLFLINIDKYDRKVWAEFGELYERMGKLLEALSAYNKANFLPDKDYTDKIEELKNKLES